MNIREKLDLIIASQMSQVYNFTTAPELRFHSGRKIYKSEIKHARANVKERNHHRAKNINKRATMSHVQEKKRAPREECARVGSKL